MSVVRNGTCPVLGRLLVSAGAAALGFSVASAAVAQAGAIAQPVVQALPSRNGQTLNQALARLGQNPRDIDALIDAGNAALAMGDVDAAVGFFRRADQIAPGNGRVKAGLAGSLVHSENPYDAIPMFDEAERDGAAEGLLAGERGLAYDLVGDNEKAQRYYKLALARESDEEVIRRLALSYAIAGDRASSEATLTPLLQRQDKAAWRTRAFSLAVLGQVNEAVAIANLTLPASLSAGISPYLRYMPRLTPAQQAAAANLGHFPRASEIGRDDPRVAQYAPKAPRKGAPLQASADAALTPRGQPLGRGEKPKKESKRDRERAEALAANTAARTPAASASRSATAAAPASPSRTRTALAEPARPVAPTRPVSQPPRTSALSPTVAPPAASRSSAAGELPPVSAQLAPSRTVTTAAPTPAPSLPVSSPAVQGPSPATVAAISGPPAPSVATLGPPATPSLAAVTPAPAAIAPTPVAPAPPPVKVNLADAFSDFARPTIDVAPVAGAVDIRRLVPARQASEPAPTAQAVSRDAQAAPRDAKTGKAAAAKPAKPPPPSHPSRIWVQIATGRNKAALAFDWRRLTRENTQVFRGKQAFTSTWGQTNRLLTGPFPTEAAANAFMTQLRRADVDGSFLWNSPAGQVVDPIAAGK